MVDELNLPTLEDEEYEGSDAQFLSMCLSFLNDKDDPTRYTEWDAERFEKLAPGVHAAWVAREAAEEKFQYALMTVYD